ncbi:hydantoinase/oxoprolinase family protein [Acuticoccus mangrovi]|uniref:Hydantoinase/oxoprolinase family protein n=1 Tax=Acuticoccus mangrovi TaxID=2796142 RepID=A0A934MEQ6_9HYPH|nr:hydantoinase/oxoprolinase family protein [Acuticoccus mangrovi]MBJ3774145.1 hydantoinase/oxoprolinase family protein [Acuticoccus mangrovi]
MADRPNGSRALPSIAVGIDVGGTFTDAIVADLATGACLDAFKLPSTPQDPAIAVLHAVDRIKESHPLDGVIICHGTTVGTNALIERRGVRTALVATEGFTDVIELRRQARPELYTFDVRISEPLVAPGDRFGLAARTDAEGREIAPLPDLGPLVEKLRAAGFEAVAVCLLHAYAAPEHEHAVGAALDAALPEAFVSLSSDVAPEIGEFERTSTTVVNAYIGPRVRGYLERLHKGLAERGAGGLAIVKSSGGLTTPQNAARYPAHLVESGPAAGLTASARFGATIGEPNVLAFDMGGTTAKAGVVVDGEPRIITEFYADSLVEGRRTGGYPILSPVIDVVEIGAGGGSIAYLDEAGVLKVGPESAGASPGPACYGKGGTRPTVTDAHAVIGTLRPGPLAQAGITLRPDLARIAIDTHLARPLGWDVAQAAHAILEIATANMAEMVRLATVRRGLDVRDFTMVPSGGAGPLHASAIAREVGIERIAVPPLPGMFSALGATLAPVRHDVSRSLVTTLATLTADALAAAFVPLIEKMDALFAAETIPLRPATTARLADIRFRGQLFELSIPLGAGGEPVPEPAAIDRAFRDAYVAEYGFDLPGSEVELVSLRLVATAEREGGATTATLAPDAASLVEDGAVLGRDGAAIPTRFLDAAALGAGHTLAGPAVVAVGGATVWIDGPAEITRGADGGVRIALTPRADQEAA